MKIPHEFVEGDTAQFVVRFESNGRITEGEEPACEVCTYPASHFNHRQPDGGLLGELFDFVVDNVSIGKIPAPPNGLLSRCSKVLSR